MTSLPKIAENCFEIRYYNAKILKPHKFKNYSITHSNDDVSLPAS